MSGRYGSSSSRLYGSSSGSPSGYSTSSSYTSPGSSSYRTTPSYGSRSSYTSSSYSSSSTYTPDTSARRSGGPHRDFALSSRYSSTSSTYPHDSTSTGTRLSSISRSASSHWRDSDADNKVETVSRRGRYTSSDDRAGDEISGRAERNSTTSSSESSTSIRRHRHGDNADGTKYGDKHRVTFDDSISSSDAGASIRRRRYGRTHHDNQNIEQLSHSRSDRIEVTKKSLSQPCTDGIHCGENDSAVEICGSVGQCCPSEGAQCCESDGVSQCCPNDATRSCEGDSGCDLRSSFEIKSNRHLDTEKLDVGSRTDRDRIVLIAHESQSSEILDQNRNNKTGGKLVGSVLARSQPDAITAKLPHADLSKEVQNLETLCEARTKELTFTKLKLKEVTLAFDAMTVLVRYLSEELDAFSCPVLKQELASAQEQLNNKQTIISEFQDKVASLEGEIISLQEKHAEVEKGLKAEHVGAMETAEQKLKQQHREEIEKVQDRFSKDKDRLKAFHGRNIEEMNQLMQNLKLTHQEEMLLLQKKQDAQMEELHRQHKDRLEEITKRFEGIKRTLSEKVETLFCECDDLRARARMCEEALQRDTDFKVQMALAPYKDLPREIESLKTVVEMRNDEIRGLKDQKFDLEGQLEELSIAREKIISLHQKNENLEAIVNIKTDHEKQLSDKCQHLLKRCDKESRAKKRVSMDYEELMWRMNHSSEFGSDDSLYQRQLSRSPTESETNSPNVTRRAVSSNDSYINGRSNDRTASNSPPRYHGGLSVSYTEKSPRKGDSDCGSGTNSLERTFNRRSGTFIMEHKSKTPPKEPLLLSSSSPQSSICTVIQYPREQSPSSLSSDSPSVSQQMDSSLIFDCGDVFGDDDNHEQCNNNNVDVSK